MSLRNGGPSNPFRPTNQADELNTRLMEQDNDRRVAEELHSKVSAIKSFTIQVQEDVNNQNRFLDDMGLTVDRAGTGLRASFSRLNVMMATSHGRSICQMVGIALFIFLVWYWYPRSQPNPS
ncbi:hypothetical protein DFJ74DRAFT_513005 [Hyaloraphidium curvatum]|nr:hypothetical protein DFJ74DRAFT_513005 [Hyaloraphidium curvatum]